MLGDSFVNGLLLIHDLHPFDLRTRLNLALETVRLYMDSHGRSVEIISLEDGVAKLKLNGNCKGCSSSAATLELRIKQAIEENCPYLMGLKVDGASSINLVSDGKMQTSSSKGCEMKPLELSGAQLIVCKASDQMYAYRNLCPACDLPLNTGKLKKNILSCKLGHSYDVQQAVKCTLDDDLHIDPFPLLQENGSVKIAVG